MLPIDVDQVMLWLKTYGLLGVFLGLFLKGWIVPKPVLDREISRSDAYEAIAKGALSASLALAQSLKAKQE